MDKCLLCEGEVVVKEGDYTFTNREGIKDTRKVNKHVCTSCREEFTSMVEVRRAEKESEEERERERAEVCPQCGGTDIEEDNDVFDRNVVNKFCENCGCHYRLVYRSVFDRLEIVEGGNIEG